jgi:ABC-type sugar transport system substrate-binding protein
MKHSRRIVTLVSVLGVALAAAFLARTRGNGPDAASSAPDTPPMTSTGAKPEFRQPEQATQYREAMSEGNQRALAVLNAALEQARAQPSTNPEQITHLEQEIRRREAILKEVAAVR